MVDVGLRGIRVLEVAAIVGDEEARALDEGERALFEEARALDEGERALDEEGRALDEFFKIPFLSSPLLLKPSGPAFKISMSDGPALAFGRSSSESESSGTAFFLLSLLAIIFLCGVLGDDTLDTRRGCCLLSRTLGLSAASAGLATDSKRNFLFALAASELALWVCGLISSTWILFVGESVRTTLRFASSSGPALKMSIRFAETLFLKFVDLLSSESESCASEIGSRGSIFGMFGLRFFGVDALWMDSTMPGRLPIELESSLGNFIEVEFATVSAEFSCLEFPRFPVEVDATTNSDFSSLTRSVLVGFLSTFFSFGDAESWGPALKMSASCMDRLCLPLPSSSSESSSLRSAAVRASSLFLGTYCTTSFKGSVWLCCSLFVAKPLKKLEREERSFCGARSGRDPMLTAFASE